jgi:hypothetical protein
MQAVMGVSSELMFDCKVAFFAGFSKTDECNPAVANPDDEVLEVLRQANSWHS